MSPKEMLFSASSPTRSNANVESNTLEGTGEGGMKEKVIDCYRPSIEIYIIAVGYLRSGSRRRS